LYTQKNDELTKKQPASRKGSFLHSEIDAKELAPQGLISPINRLAPRSSSFSSRAPSNGPPNAILSENILGDSFKSALEFKTAHSIPRPRKSSLRPELAIDSESSRVEKTADFRIQGQEESDLVETSHVSLYQEKDDRGKDIDIFSATIEKNTEENTKDNQILVDPYSVSTKIRETLGSDNFRPAGKSPSFIEKEAQDISSLEMNPASCNNTWLKGTIALDQADPIQPVYICSTVESRPKLMIPSPSRASVASKTGDSRIPRKTMIPSPSRASVASETGDSRIPRKTMIPSPSRVSVTSDFDLHGSRISLSSTVSKISTSLSKPRGKTISIGGQIHT